MKYIKISLFVLITLCAANAFAVNYDSPVKMLREVSTDAIDQLKQNKKDLNSSKQVPLKKIHHIIHKVLLPHVDLDNMARVVLGRNVWQKASTKQQERFKVQFTNLVINTYASALTTFDKNRIKFFPVRGGYEGKTIVQVNSEVDAPGSPPLPVVYHLQRKKNGKWLVYDLSVDGISLVQSYKAQFSAIIHQSNLEGLLKTLEKHNATLAATK